MKEHTAMWIMPPGGEAYGFPKLYYPNIHGDLKEWLVKEGYPVQQIHPTMIVKFEDKK